MKKNILLGLLVFGQIGVSVAQKLPTRIAELNTSAPKNTHGNGSVEKAVGVTFYHDNFDSTVVNNVSIGNSAWTINNSGQTGPTFGWTIDNVSNGWWAAATGIQSSSEGKYAELSNGNPTSNPATQALGVTYTMTTTTPIDIQTMAGTDQVTLSFEQYGARFNDLQEILISTDGTTWVSVGNNSDIPVLSQSGGAPYSNPQIKSINLAPYISGNASSVSIRFSWTTNFPSEATNPNVWVAYGWYIDDLKLTTNSDDQVALTDVFIGDIINDFSYSVVPTAQTTPMVIGVALRNDGVNDFSDDINISIKLGGTEVENFDTPYTLASGAFDTVWITSTYTPSTIGNYTVDVSIPADDEPADNTGSATVATSQYVYAHDFGGTTQRGFDQDDETAMGNLYLMQADQDISSVNVKFRTGTTVGQEVIIGVYEIGANIQDQSFVAEAFYTIAQPDIAASFVTIELDDAVTLNAGSIYCVSIKKQAGTSRLYVTGTEGDNDFGTACYGPFGAGDAVNWYNGWGWSPYVRANFDPSLAIKETSILQDVNVYPNPSANNTTVKFNLANSSNVEIKVLDITGKTVETINIDNAAAGANDANLNISNYATGVYNVVISSNESSVTKKFVKK